MRYIEVKKHQVTPGLELIRANYPQEDGVYDVGLSDLYIVKGQTIGIFVNGATFVRIPVEQPQAAGITGTDVANILAVALHSRAAEEFVKKGGAA